MKLKVSICAATLLSLMALQNNAYASEDKKGHGKHLSQFINKFDSNKDSKVTIEEFTSSIAQRFKKMDVDENGVVSEDEFKQFAKSNHQQHRAKHKEKIDTNKDGLISKQEFLDARLKKAEKKFAKLDVDNDGLLSEKEMAGQKHKSRFKKPSHYFPKIDTNNDGVISPEENKASSERLFKRLDSNNDQTISQEEISSMSKHRKRKE